MKIHHKCLRCTFEEEKDFDIQIALAEDPIYTFVCDKGHENIVLLQNSKYEMLFESGMYAYLDGYYREAITSFHVALERFYEFIILGVLGNRMKLKYEDLTPLLKKIYLSERLTGAYSIILFTELQSTEIFDSNYKFTPKVDGFKDPIQFRNKVIHEGYIPTASQTVQYGKAVSGYINAIIDRFNAVDPNLMVFAYGIKFAFYANQIREQAHTVLSTRTFLDLVRVGRHEFEEYVKLIDKNISYPTFSIKQKKPAG